MTNTAKPALTVFFIAILILAGIFALLAFRRGSLRRTDLLGGAAEVLNWTNWTIYIPLLGGVVCFFIGILELAWMPCVIGLVAVGIGSIRLWAKGRMRQALRDRIGKDDRSDIDGR